MSNDNEGVTESETTLTALLQSLPRAIWSKGEPLPLVYQGSPLEMVEQMASEISDGITPSEAMQIISDDLAKRDVVHLEITGDPNDETRAGIFIYALLQSGTFLPVPTA